MLVEIACNGRARVRDIAAAAGLAGGTLQAIITDLEAGYLSRSRAGRRAVCAVHPDRPFRHPALAEQSWRPVHLDTSFVRELGEPAEPYERPLHAALAGDHRLFAREDSAEETWRIVQPLLDRPPDVMPYPRGSWGPDDAETLGPRSPSLAAAVDGYGGSVRVWSCVSG